MGWKSQQVSFVSATYPTDAKLGSQITEPRQYFGTKQHTHGTDQNKS